jgi:hypothetical protein
VQLVLPVHVGDPARPAAGRTRAQGPGGPPHPAGRVDHQIGRQIRAIHPQAGGPATLLRNLLGMPAPDLEARRLQCLRAQRALERLPAGPHAQRDNRAATQRHHGPLGPRRLPAAQRPRQLGLQGRRDLRAEPVRVVELHHALTRPGAIRGRPRVALHRGDLMTPLGQRGPEEQARRPGPDDGDSHDCPLASIHPRCYDYTYDALNYDGASRWLKLGW